MRAEVARRLVHASGAGAPALYLLELVTWEQLRLGAIVGIVVTLVLEIVRLQVGLDWWVFDKLTREYEQENLAGYALYMFSGSAVILTFEPSIAVPAVLMLTLGDPVSGLAGSGELRRVKRPEVMALMFGVCLALALPFLRPSVAALAAAAATLADGVKPIIWGYVIDDNVTIPIAAAVAGQAGLWYLPELFV
ncbi:dolichol kinase [Halobacteriales archaeon QS_1_68_20]|nr:MAG: dolichol kinase [Halobacteriales archaeon QS_1_68_20]